MKLYESAYTYFPFLYLFVVASIFGGLYHNTKLMLYQPYLIMIFFLINTIVYFVHDTKTLIKTVVHRHVWKTVTLSIFGILVNNIHTEMFSNFHFTNWYVNAFMSLLYIIIIFTCRYYLEEDRYMVYTHIVFLFFPLQRVWQVNLYVYIVFTTISIFLLFQRVLVRDLKDKTMYTRPVIDYFMYLRIYDMFVIIGFIQLYFDFYKTNILPEIKAVEEIQRMINEERNNIGKHDEDE
jgi:hypothetical protein